MESPEEIWDRAMTRFKAMTKEEKFQTFVDSGILTSTGEVCKPYRNAIKKKTGMVTIDIYVCKDCGYIYMEPPSNCDCNNQANFVTGTATYPKL